MTIRYEILEDIIQTGAYVTFYGYVESIESDIMVVNYGVSSGYFVFVKFDGCGWAELDYFTVTDATTTEARRDATNEYMQQTDFVNLLANI